MSDAPTSPRRYGRLATALGGLLMSAFFLALTALILAAPRDEGPILIWISLCAFVVLMFGSIALAGLYPSYALIRERWLRRPLRHLEDRCPGCGALHGGPAACARCGHPAGERLAYWSVTKSERSAPILGLGFGGAIVALGVFMACYTVESGRIITGILGGLFSLLLVVAGAGCSAGAIMALKNDRRPAARLRYDRAWTRGNTTANTRVELSSGRDGPAASGLTKFTVPLEGDPLDSPLVSRSEEDRAPEEPRDSPRARALVAALAEATPFERGLMTLLSVWEYEGRLFAVLERSIAWTWPPAPHTGDAQRGRAYRAAAPRDDDDHDGVDRVERDGWYLSFNGPGLARMFADAGFEGDLRAIDAIDEGFIQVRELVRTARASEVVQDWVESFDPGTDPSRIEIPSHIFRAVRASA